MLTTEVDQKDPNRVIKIWTKISDHTGVNMDMVAQIHRSSIKERKTTN